MSGRFHLNMNSSGSVVVEMKIVSAIPYVNTTIPNNQGEDDCNRLAFALCPKPSMKI
jgi:hypothetical protein